MSAASAQQAALHILLEDVEPLLQRAEAAALDVQAAREALAADLATLATLVQRSVEAPSALLEAARRLDSAAARIEAAMQSRGDAEGLTRSAARVPAPRWRVAALLCAVSALSGAATTAALGWEDPAPARLGRALQRGWASLDAPTRARVEEVLRR